MNVLSTCKYLVFIFLIVMFGRRLWALEIDEKLTLRVLKTSTSKKTVLINRGLEDGLTVGDHAKFFLTKGVLARGVVVKASPTRSIWSVYRLISPDHIIAGKALNLKISSPVKLSGDMSKSLHRQMVAVTDETNIPIAETSAGSISSADRDDLSYLEEAEAKEYSSVNYSKSSFSKRDLELFSLLQFNSFSSDANTGIANISGKSTNLDVTAGVEKYFLSRKSFYANFTLFIMYRMASSKTQSVEGDAVTMSVAEYGGGLNYHFTDPFRVDKPIVFIQAGGGIGEVEDVVSVDRTRINTAFLLNQTLQGTHSFMNFGIGVKYFLRWGLGARMLLDYYRRNENYTVAGVSAGYTRVVAGPRLLFGLSYRW